MGILDNVKNRLGISNEQNNYDDQYDDDQYYDDPEADYIANTDASEHVGGSGRVSTNRSGYMIDDHPPLISMTDVRSQELPPLDAQRSASQSSTRTTGNRATAADCQQSSNFPVYDIADSTPDALLKRHSLSNTGNFESTSPAYYASRSGIGRVRSGDSPAPLGSAVNRQQGFRETIVIRPQNYAEAEQIANNLRQGNAVAVVLTNTRPELAKRILDFAFGATAALQGQVDSPANKVYIFTLGYALTNQELELLQARGVL